MATCDHDHLPGACARDRACARDGWIAAVVPVLACALCPAHLAMLAQALSVIGLPFSLDASTHVALLAVALVTSLGLTLARAVRERRAWPVGLAGAGAALVVGAHVAGDIAWLEWLGIAALVAGAVAGPWAARRARRAPIPVLAPAAPST